MFVFLNKTKYLLSLCARYSSNGDDIVPAYVDCLQGYCVENPPYSSISPLLSCCCHILNTSVPRGMGVFPTPSKSVTPDSSPTIHSILILSTWSEGHITLVKRSVPQDFPHPYFRCQSQVQVVTCASD